MEKISSIIKEIPYILITYFILISIGISAQYSVSADWEPWAINHLIKSLFFIPIIFIVGVLNLKTIFRYSYFIFIFSIVSLVLVQLFGKIGMGAQRWIDFYIFKIQPSEFTKISMILYLSKFYSQTQDTTLFTHIKAAILAFIPIIIVANQPDLGTALLLLFLLGMIITISGIKIKYIIAVLILFAISLPITWQHLHTYQKQRIISFINPENDPLGNGYHIIQSKIAIGSGGIYGKGFLKGTQSKLNFLPEKHTDFIFTSICEETGLIGGVMIIILFIVLISNIMIIAYSSPNRFCLLLGISTAFLIFEHVIINIAMVSGLLPVVGVPLPFISYGGSSLLSFSILIGLVANIAINKKKIKHL